MKIEPIIYETTRGIYSVEDKLSIATLILFCWKLGNRDFCELLYTKNHNNFILTLSKKYSKYDIKLDIKLSDKNINTAFYKTIEKVKEKYDSDGYLKALFNKDKFALVIEDIINYNFNKVEFKKFTKNIEQLKINFNE
mgnify:CR=1 FL=1